MSQKTTPTRVVNSANPLVFVYGTLKEGFGNHEAFLKGRAERIGGIFVLPESYYMISLTGFPGVLSKAAMPQAAKIDLEPTRILGELYRLNGPTVLEGLDGLEGHPSFYKREQVTFTLPDGSKERGWTYLLPYTWMLDSDLALKETARDAFIEDGCWRPNASETSLLATYAAKGE